MVAGSGTIPQPQLVGARELMFAMRYLTAFLYTAFAVTMLVTSTPAFALSVTDSRPTWGSYTTYQKKTSVTFRVRFSGDVDETTLNSGSFRFSINGSLVRPTGISRQSATQYEATYSGSALNDFRGLIDLYAFSETVKGLDGTYLTNSLLSGRSHAVIGGLVDNKGPVITLQDVPASAGLNPFEITLDLDSNGVLNDATAFSVTNATRSTPVQGANSREFISTVTPDGNGPIQLNVAAGLFADSLGNLSTAETSATVALDTTKPTMTISDVLSTVGLDPFTATFTASEAVQSFAASDIVLVNAAVSAFDVSNAPVFTAVITPDGNGDVSVSVPA